MNPFRATALLLLAGLLALPGCGGGEEAKSTAADEDPVAARTPRNEDDTPSVPPPPTDDAPNTPTVAVDPEPAVPGIDDPALADVTEIRGRWLLRLTQLSRGIDFPLALLEVDEDGRSARAVETVDLLEGAKIDEITIDGKSFHMRATLDSGSTFDAVGELRDGLVWGNAELAGRTVLFPFKLLPTKIGSLDTVELSDTAGRDAFIDAVQEGSSESFETFARQHPSSPLAMAAQQNLLLAAKKNEETAEQVRARVQRYREVAAPWGERYQRDALHTSALILAEIGHEPDVARELVAELRSELGESPGEHWTEQLADLDRRIDVFTARNALENGTDEAAKAKARATLAAAHEAAPTDPTVAYSLATDAEARGEKEEALRLYAELTALPGLELDLVDRWQQLGTRAEPPSDRFRALWTELHGEDDAGKRDEFLTEVYEDRTFYFQGDAATPRTESEGNQVVLVELFTGAQCPGCAMADIAISGAQRKFANTELIALRYHQHIPRPDPFATPTSEARFFYYEGQATPTILVNGRETVGIGGTQLSQVEPAWKMLMEEIEPELPKRTDVTIDLSAVAEDETLTVKAKVDGLGKEAARPRLRIAVAESTIEFASRNGVRVQEMVVRWMLPDVDGIAPNDAGDLEYEESFELPELKQQLVDALDDFEKSRNVEFVRRPMDLRNLKVVALVQDDSNLAVLQAKVVPLEGKPVFDVPGAVPGE